MPSINDALLGAAIAVAVAVISATSAFVTAAVVNRRERSERHQDRLRALYADVMLAAMRLMPDAFPVRLGRGMGPTTKDEIDVLGSRLRLERWQEGDHILEELITFWRAVREWNAHANEPERKADVVDPLRRKVLKSFQSLEDEMRKNLGMELGPPGSSRRR